MFYEQPCFSAASRLRCITDQKTSRSQPVRTDSGDDRKRWRKQVFLNRKSVFAEQTEQW